MTSGFFFGAMKMSKQSYPGASEGERAETGEKEPKGAKSSDASAVQDGPNPRG